MISVIEYATYMSIAAWIGVIIADLITEGDENNE